MTETQQKIKAVLLTVLMVTSVVAATVAFSGAAAAANRGTGGFDYSTGPADNNPGGNGDSAGEVGPGETVFQGEEDLTGDFSGTGIGELQKVSGDNEGILLESPIPQDQPTGTYTNDGSSTSSGGVGVTLQTPRVTDIEVQNSGGGDVTGSTLQVSSQPAVVGVDYNYEEAEDIEITVEDEDGLDVTNEIVSGDAVLNPETGSAGSPPSGFDVGFELDTEDVDEGEYTITVEGVEDLDFGDATETVTVNISTDQQSSLNLDNDEVIQGENLRFTADNSPEGNYHAVVIESSEFREGIDVDRASSIFRDVGDVTEAGVVGQAGTNEGPVTDADSDGTLNDELGNGVDDVAYAYAIVEIDGGNGIGSVETQHLDDSSIDVDLYRASSDNTPNYASGGSHLANTDLTSNSVSVEVDDDQTFDIVEGEVSIDSPDGTYVTGSEVDVNGTANEGVDNVAIYARDNNEYELISIDGSSTINVEGDDTFTEEDIDISTGSGPGNSILDLPGTYRIGVIDAQDANADAGDTNSLSGNSDIDTTLSTSNFNSGVSSSKSIRVTDTALNGTFVTYNGQIASEDGRIDVEGQAPGKNNVIIAFVDNRGTVAAQEITVDDDDSFSEEDISLETNFGTNAGTQLSQGTVTAHIISSGRDGTFGEDGTAVSGPSDLEGFDGTGDQVRDRILSNTVDDTGSDDLIVNERFRLNDGLTTVESTSSPTEVNGTLEIQGTTNRSPDDNTISVELLDAEDESVTVESTDEWGSNGEWSVSLDLSDTDIEPGNYTVESDDGDSTDRQNVQVVEAGSLEEEQPEDTPEPETDTPEPETDTPEPETDTPEPETEMDTEMQTEMETEEATTEASGPGFTAAIALIALVAAALLAVRRDN